MLNFYPSQITRGSPRNSVQVPQAQSNKNTIHTKLYISYVVLPLDGRFQNHVLSRPRERDVQGHNFVGIQFTARFQKWNWVASEFSSNREI